MVLSEDEEQLQEGERFEAGEETGRGVKDKMPRSNDTEEGLLEDDTTKVYSTVHTGEKIVKPSFQVESPEEAASKSSGEDEGNNTTVEEPHLSKQVHDGHGIQAIPREQIAEANVVFVTPKPIEEEMPKNHQDRENETKDSREEDGCLKSIKEGNVNDLSQESIGVGPTQNFEDDKKETTNLSKGETFYEQQTASVRACERIALGTIHNTESLENIPGASLVKRKEGLQGEVENQHSTESSIENRDEVTSSIKITEIGARVTGGEEETDHTLKNDEPGETDREVESPGEVLDTAKQGNGLQGDDDNLVPPETSINKRDELTSSVKTFGDNHENNRLAEATENSAKTTPEDSEPPLQRDETGESIALETAHGVEIPKNIPDLALVKQDEGLQEECEKITPPEAEIEKRHEDTSYNSLSEATENSVKATPEGQEDSEHALHKHETRESIALETNHGVEKPKNIPESALVKQEEVLQGEVENQYSTESSIENRDKETSSIKVAEDNDKNNRPVETTENHARVIQQGEEERDQILPNDEPGETDCEVESPGEVLDTVKQGNGLQGDDEKVVPPENSFNKRDELISSVGMYGDNHENNRLADASENSAKTTPEGEDSEPLLKRDETAESITLETNHEVEVPKYIPDPALVKQEEGLQEECEELASTEAEIEKGDGDISYVKVTEDNYANNKLVEGTENSTKTTPKGEEDPEKSIVLETAHGVEIPKNIPDLALVKQEEGLQAECEKIASPEAEIEKQHEDTSCVKVVEDKDVNNNLAEATENSAKATPEGQEDSEHALHEHETRESIALETYHGVESPKNIPDSALVKQEEVLQGEVENQYSTESSIENRDEEMSSIKVAKDNDENNRPAETTENHARVVQQGDEETDHVLQNDESGETNCEAFQEILDTVKQGNYLQGDDDNLVPETLINKKDELTSSVEVFGDKTENNGQAEATENSAKTTPESEEDSGHALQRDETGESIAHEANHGVEGPRNTPNPALVKQEEGLQAECEKLAPTEAEIEKRQGDISYFKVAEDNNANNKLAEDTERNTKILSESGEDSYKVLLTDEPGQTIRGLTNHNVKSPENNLDSLLAKQGEGMQGESDNLGQTKTSIKVAEDEDNIGPVETTKNSIKVILKGEEDSEHVLQKDDPQQKPIQERNHDVEKPEENLDKSLVNQEEDLQVEGENLAPTEASMENKDEDIPPVKMAGHKAENNMQDEDRENSPKGTPKVEDSEHSLSKDAQEIIGCEADREIEGLEKFDNSPLVNQEVFLQREGENLISKEASVERRDENTSYMKIAKGNNNDDNDGLAAEAADISVKATGKGEENLEEVLQKDEPGKEPEQLLDVVSEDKEAEYILEKMENTTLVKEEGIIQNLEETSEVEKKEETKTVDDKKEKEAAIEKVFNTTSFSEETGVQMAEEIHNVRDRSPEFNEKEITKENSIEEQQCGALETAASSTNTEKSVIEKPATAELPSSSDKKETVKESLKEEESDVTVLKEEAGGTALEFIKQTDLTEKAKAETLQDCAGQSRDFTALTTIENYFIIPEVPVEEINEKLLKQEKNTIIDSDSASEAVVSELGLKETKPDNKEHAKSFDIVPEEKGLATIETGVSLDSVDIEVQSEENSKSEENMSKKILTVADETGEKIEHQMEDKAPTGGIDNELSLTSRETTLDGISEDGSRDSYIMPLQEHEPTTTEVGKIMEETSARDEIAKIPSSVQKTDEKLIQKEDESINPTDVSELLSSDDGKDGAIEELKHEDAELHMPPKRHIEKNSYETEDVEISKRGETSALADQTEVCKLESLEVENPSDDPSKPIAVSPYQGSEKTILEQGDFVQTEGILTGVLVEKGTTGMKTNVCSHECEPTNAKTNELLAEKNLESDDLGQKLVFGTESEAKDPSHETLPQTNKSQTEENSNDVQDWNFESVEPQITPQVQGKTETKMAMETKLKAEDQINVSPTTKETITTHTVTEGVHERIQEVDGSEGIKEQAIHGDIELKETHKVSAEDYAFEKVEDCGTKSTDYLEATDSEQTETVKADIQEATRETETSGTKALKEEKIQDEFSLKPEGVMTAVAKDSEEKIKVEVDHFLEENDNATVVPAESIVGEVPMDDKAVKETSSDERLETITIQPRPQAEEAGSKKLRIEGVDGSESSKEQAIQQESQLKEIYEVSTEEDILEKVEDSGTKSSTYLEETDFSEQTETLTTNIQETTREIEASGTKAPEEVKPVEILMTEAKDKKETIKEEIQVEADNLLGEDGNATAVPAESPIPEAHMDDKAVKETSSDESVETITIQPCPQAEEVGSKKLQIEEVDGNEGIKEQVIHEESELKEIHKVYAEDDILEKVEDCGRKSSDYLEETDSNEQTETFTPDIQEPTRETEASGTKAPEDEKIQDEVSLKPVEISTKEVEDTKETIKEEIEVEANNLIDEDGNAIQVPAESPILEAHMSDKAVKETSSDESVETITIQSCPQAEEVGSKKLRIEEVDGSEGTKEEAIHGESELKEIHKVHPEDDILEKVEDCGTKSSYYLEEIDSSEQIETLTADIQEPTRETEASGTKGPEEEEIQDEVSLKPVEISTTEAEDTKEMIKEKIKVETDNFLDEDDNATAVPAESPIPEVHMDDKAIKETRSDESIETIRIQPCPQAEEVGSKKLRIEEVDGSEGIKEKAIHGESESKEIHKVSTKDDIVEKVEDSGTKSSTYLEETDFSEQTETLTANIQETTRETEASGTKAEEKIQDEVSLKPVDVSTTEAEDTEETIKGKIKVEADNILDEDDNAIAVPAESPVREAHMGDKVDKETSLGESLETVTIHPCPQAEDVGSKKLPIEEVDGSEGIKEQDMHGEQELKEIHRVSAEDDILQKVEDCGTKSSDYQEETDSSEQTETLTADIQEPTRETEASRKKAPEEEKIQDEVSLKPVEISTTEAEDTKEMIKEKIKVETDNFLDEDDNATAVPAESPIPEVHMDDKAIKETRSDESIETIRIQPCPQAEEVGSKKLRIEEVDGSEGIKEKAIHGESESKEIHKVSTKDDIVEKVEDSGTKSSTYLEETDFSEQTETLTANIQETTRETEASGTKAEEKIQDEVSLKPVDVSTTEAEDTEETIKGKIKVEADNILDEDDNAIAVPAESPVREAHMGDKVDKETSLGESLETVTIHPCPQAEDVGSKKLPIEEVDGSEGIKEQDMHGEQELKEIHRVSAEDDILQKVEDCGTKSSDYQEETDSNEQTETLITDIQEPTRETEASRKKAPEEEKIQDEVSLKPVEISTTEAEDTKETIKEKIKVEADNFLDEDDNATAVLAESPIPEAHMDDKAIKETRSDESVETITIQPCPHAEEVGSKKLRLEEVDGSEGTKEKAIYGESELKEIHKVYAKHDIVEKVDDCGTKSSDYLEETDSSDQTETVQAFIQEQPRETEALGAKAPEEENIQDEVSLKLVDVLTTEAKDTEETIKEKIKVEADNILDEDDNATAVPAESPISEAYMNDKAVKETCPDESLETVTIQPCPQVEDVGSKKLPIEEVDGSEGIKGLAMHGERELKEIHRVSAEDDILQKVEDCGTKSFNYLEATDPSEQTATVKANIQEQTMETELSGTKALEEENIQDEVSLKPANVLTIEAKDAEEKIKEYTAVEADKFLDENDNATAVPAESCIGEAHMDVEAIKEISSDESLEIITIENIRLEQEEPMVHKNEEKESVIPVKPGADEVEDVKKSPNTVVSSKYLGVEETQETGQSLRVEKLDSDRTEEGIKEDSGTMSEAKSLGIEMVTQGEMTYGQTLPTGNLEEEFQTPSSALLSLEREHGPTTVVKEAEATKIMEEEIIDDKNIDDSLATKATEEACLQNKEQLQTLSSALLSKEQEHEAQTAFKKTEEESTKEVETLDDKNINNFSAIKESEETGLEQEEPMDHEHVEKESATLEKQDTDDVEVTKTVSAADSRPKYFGGEETYEIGESFRVEKLDSEGNEEGVKESSVTVFKSESLGIETVTKDEMTPDQTLPAVNLEEHFQIESSELHSLGQEHGPTTAVMDTEAIKTTEAKMLDDETCLQKEEQLQTLSSTLLSGVQEHIAKAAFKKTEEDSIKEMEMLGDKNINNLAIKATENTNLEQEVHRELKVSTLGLEINKEVQKGSLNKSLEEEYCTLDGFSKLETEENEERTYPHIVSETRELTKPIEEASNIRFEISEKSIESALHVHCQEVLLNPEEKIQDEGIVKLEVDNSCDKTENATSNVETTESSSGEAALNDVSTKDTSSVESSLETVKTVSSTLAKEVASMNLEKTSSSFLTQLPNIVDKNSEKASESQKSIDANEVEETKTASGAVFESKYQTDETGERLTVEKLDAAEGKETKGTSETSSNSKALCVEADSKDDVIAGQTLAAGKLGDQLQTIFSSFLSREQEHGTTTAGERTEEEEMKGAKMIGDESIDNSSAAKTTEGTCLKMKEHMELEVSTLGLESSKATHRGSSNEVQEEEGSKLDQASKLEPHEKEEMKYDDSPSVVQSHQVLPKSEDMKEKHLEAAMTDLNAEESQCKETVEENQIFKNRVSMEEVREVMEENEVAKDSQSVSLGDETIIESHQGDELKAVACPEEETNKTFKATTNANQHEALKLPELIDKDSASENIEKKITAEESSYLDEAEGKNIEEAVSELDLDYKSGETHITKEKTEVIALSEKEVVVEISQKEGTAGFSEVNEITEDIQQLEKNSYAASEKKIPVEEEPSENKEAAFITDNEDVLPVLQHPSDKALQKVELEHERPGKATEVDAEERRIECEGEKRMGGSGEINKESASVDSEKMSSSDLMQISMKKSLHAAKNLTKEREPMPSKAEIKNEGAETTQIDKARADEEEGDEHKRSEPDSDAPVMVEASKDTEAKVPHKKSHNILSGVGSKVKHSISKVKKAITGKSSHPKTSSLK
ncbi:titin isoform X16 [Juglans microcarpa x Juglans regia]|uniref:titin isoform X16 n=1 Tax=Juglans microcarpa x Juglans regia TaxID=2249226 RepID=UPI001B7DD06A|nr:titin isoform X16 [Juglans microcarpa x Juglans regia]